MGQCRSFATHESMRFSTYLSPSGFRPTPSLKDPAIISDGSYEHHTDPLQYHTYGNVHGHTIITIPLHYLLRYIPRCLVWWVTVARLLLFWLFKSSAAIAMIRRDWAFFRNLVSHVLWRRLDASQLPPTPSREHAVILNGRY